MINYLKANKTNPLIQASGILLLMIIFMIVNRGIQSTGYESNIPSTAWEIMASFILFFSLVNCVFSLQSINQISYWRLSIFSFIGLLVVGGFISYLFSGLGIFEAGSIGWILFILSFAYLIFLSIVNIMRYVVDLAQKQDRRLRGEDD